MATTGLDGGATISDHDSSSGSTFVPRDRTKSQSSIELPNEVWMTVLDSTCTFGPDIFSTVMLNLVKNPNITASHLFRADIFYDSDKDCAISNACSSMKQHLKSEYRPIESQIPGFRAIRTIVRQLIPRNPQLDSPLVQTCHFYSNSDSELERSIVLYIPHVSRVDNIPFYHPAVSRLAFEHRWPTACSRGSSPNTAAGTISVSYCFFPDTSLNTKLERTALRLLQTVHKHGQGQLLGYEKRVHLDQLIPQKRYQDTYARLKTKYGRHLAEEWVEVTDPGKHVFEDIGIAAFLIELWRDMYSWEQRENFNGAKEIETSKPPFPGFVDIGCGNGVLVYILIVEGYDGWGFDARERKTWSIFPDQVQQRLQRCVLIPWIFGSLDHGVAKTPQHDGRFQSGTFIISNHADELTTWTPLLAYVNKSAFIAIPCCSHDLAGSRFRAPASIKGSRMRTTRLPQQIEADDDGSDSMRSKGETKQAAETGSLKRTDAQKKMPSAYSTLCSYVTSLAEELGFEPEKEVLRIPSTRNQCIIGQRGLAFEWSENQQENNEGRQRKVVQVVERELGRSVGTVGAEWITRAQNLSKKPGSGH